MGTTSPIPAFSCITFFTPSAEDEPGTMAETTSHDAEMTREETAAFLRSIADELDSGRGVIGVSIGNKGVELSPPDTIDTEATVTERSRRFRKNVEKLSLEFAWNPTQATAESEPEDEVDETDVVDEVDETGSGPRTDTESETDR